MDQHRTIPDPHTNIHIMYGHEKFVVIIFYIKLRRRYFVQLASIFSRLHKNGLASNAHFYIFFLYMPVSEGGEHYCCGLDEEERDFFLCFDVLGCRFVGEETSELLS